MNARRIVIGIAAVAALLVAAIASLPFFVDQDRVRRAIEQRISAVAGGEVHYESLKLRFFPQPSVEARNATVRIPGVLEGRVDTLAIRIALLPLLTGNVRPVAVNLAQPTLEVTIQPGGGSGGGDPFAAYRAALGPVVDALVRDASGMSLGVTDGKVVVVYAGQRIVSLSGLTADAQVAADALTVGASGAADLWRTASAHLKIAPGSLAATGKLQLSGLRLAELLQAAGAQGEVRVSAGAIDASLDAQTDGRASVRGTLTAAAPDVTLARAARTLGLGAVRAVLDAQRDGTALTASVRELKAGDLLPAATGTLRAKPDGSGPTVALQVPALDLARLRTALVALAGDLDGVQEALPFVPTGTAQALNITAAGSDFGALAALGSMRAEGQLANGALELPTFGIAVTGGAGRFALADGTLRWSELAGAIGKSTFTGGTLALDLIPDAVDLIPDPALRKLEATVDADLAGTLPIVRRLVGRPEPAALANVESLRGRASGTVVYEADRRRAHVAVDLSRVQGNVRYRGVPLPIEVTDGAVRYAGDRLDVRGLDGTLGRSQVRAGAMELTLGAVPTVRAASADAVVVLDEIYPWLASIEGLRRPTSAIPSESGTVAVRLVRLSGPLNQPAALDYEAVLRPQQVRIAGPTLPAPVTVTGGEVRVTPRTVALDRLDAAMLDARIVASGTIEDYAAPDPRFDLKLADGRAGERSLDWARTRFRLPARAMPRAPLTLSSGRLQRAGGATAPLVAQGAIGLAGDVRADFDLTAQSGHFDLRRLVVNDPDTNTTASLKWAASTLELTFKGKLDNRTFARVLAHPPKGDGALQGDFSATIDLADPRRSSATGSLEADRIDILERWDIPIEIQHVRLDVAGDVVRIHEGAFVVSGEQLALTGTVTRQPKTFGLDLRATADAIDAERLLRAFPRGEARPRDAAGWNLPVDGRIVIDAKSVTYGRYVVRPLSGTVTLAPERIVADVKEARLCDLALPLRAVLVPGSASVTSKIAARGQPVAGVVACLTGERLALTGTFDLDADLAASGPLDELARAARGTFRLTARDGEILKATAIARILSLDLVSAVLRARPSELLASGLDYSELVVAGTVDGGRVRVERGTLNAAALGLAMTGEVDVPAGQIDMRGIVAPLNRIQQVMQYVPIVGGIFGARVLGIPISVTGDLDDPRVVPLGPAAIGESLVNLIGAVVKAPIDLLDPFGGRPQPAR